MSTSARTPVSTAVRDADPAAGLSVDAESHDAQDLLRDVLSARRAAAPEPLHEPSRRRRTRLIVGGGLVAAAAVAVPVLWPGSSGPGGAAYAVTRQRDGSVHVTLNFDRFRDPRGLQRALDDKHIRAVVLVGAGNLVQVGPGEATTLDGAPACAIMHIAQANRPGTPHTDPNEPISYNSAKRFDHGALRLRPDLLPADGTFVISVDVEHGRVRSYGGDVALGKPPTCLYKG